MLREPIDACKLVGHHLDARVTVRSEKDTGEPGPEWSVRGVLDQVTHRRGDNGPSVLLTPGSGQDVSGMAGARNPVDAPFRTVRPR